MKNLYLVVMLVSFLFILFTVQGYSQEQQDSSQELEQILLQVEQLLEEENTDAAISLLNQANEIYPNNYVILYSLMSLNIMAQNYDAAYENYLQARSLIVHDGNLHLNAAEVLINLGMYDEAMQSLTAALNINPANIKVFSLLAYLYYLQKDYDRAIYYYNIVTYLNPGNLDNYLNLALCYYLSDRYNTARQILVDLINSGSTSLQVYYYLAFFMYNNGEKESSVELITQIFDQYPELNYPSMYHLLAKIYLSDNRLELARQTIQNIISIGSATFETKFILARIEYLGGNYGQSLSIFQELSDVPSYSFAAITYIGMIYLVNGYTEAALNCFSSLQEASSFTADLNSGWSYHLSGMRYSALQSYYMAWESSDENLNLIGNIGLEYIYLHEYDSAVNYLLYSIENGNHGFGYLYLSVIFVQMGLINDATSVFEYGLNFLSPSDIVLASDILMEELFYPLWSHPEFVSILQKYYQ